MGINTQGVAYNFGQLGSVYTTHGQDAIKPPTGKVFVAITMLTATVFDDSGGLVAERIAVPGATAADVSTITGDIFIGSEQPAHDLADGSETTIEGSGGIVTTDVTFPEGITKYGRWTEIDIKGSSGTIVAYIGE